MIYFATKFQRQPGEQPRRVESIGFSTLPAALSTVRSMNDVSALGVTWIVTVRLGDGSHAPAVVGQGSGAAVLIAAGVYDLEPGDMLAAS
jgi:hypothetical protein